MLLYKFLEEIDVSYIKWISTFLMLLSVPFAHEHRESVCGKLLHLSVNLLQIFRFLFRFVACFKGIYFGHTTTKYKVQPSNVHVQMPFAVQLAVVY